jgi:hypothetical protein
MNHATCTVTPLNPELIQVDDAIGLSGAKIWPGLVTCGNVWP